jgi:hypothetical protein
MEARLTLRRLLVGTAVLVALAAITSGCGGGAGAQAATERGPKLVEYSDSVLSFRHPATWKAHPFSWNGELHFRPLVYLSTQPLRDPCAMQGNSVSCGFPVGRLRPGGVLLTWNNSGPPAIGLGPGSRMRVGGHPATRVDTAHGICRSIGADRTIDVLIRTQPLPSPLMELTACLRGPGLAQAEQSVDALLASTQFHAN